MEDEIKKHKGGKRKGSLRRIPENMRLYIYKRALDDIQIPRDVLADRLAEELINIPEFKRSPSFDTLKKLISEARNIKRLPVDEYWEVAALRDPKYAIHPETKRAIFDLKFRGHPGITIRQALWMDHLMGLPLSNDILFIYASLYAEAESLAETMDIGFDTKVIDDMLTKTLSNPEKAQQTGKRWDEEVLKKGVSGLVKFSNILQ